MATGTVNSTGITLTAANDVTAGGTLTGTNIGVTATGGVATISKGITATGAGSTVSISGGATNPAAVAVMEPSAAIQSQSRQQRRIPV